MTPSVAVAVALGPIPGIVKKLAELLDFDQHQTEAQLDECLMTWEY